MTNPFESWIGPVEIDGREVAKLRKMLGMTPESLGRKAVVGKKTIERWEAEGVVNAEIEGVRSVASVLGADLLDLLTKDFRQDFERKANHLRGGTGAIPRKVKSQPTETASRLRFQLPPNLNDFVGREDVLGEIAGQIQADCNRVAISSLGGMGGIGKTTIATRIAHQIKGQFPDAQLFLDLQGVSERPMNSAEAMSRFIRDLDPTIPKLPANEDELLSLYRSSLAGKRALIVLDNAGNEAQVRPLLTGDRTCFIITSRISLALDGVTPIRIDLFTAAQSLALLRCIVGTKGTDKELTEVATLCGHLPLALRVAGHFLRLKQGWTVNQYLEALRNERLRWLRVGNDPQKDVEAVLKLSSAQLVRDDANLATQWHYLSEWESDFTNDAAAAAWNMDDEHSVLENLSTLVDRSLLLFDETTSRYRLHDLMKPIARGLFG